jgi:hypothetical protein
LSGTVRSKRTQVYGVDFSSAPTKKKPITLAAGSLSASRGIFFFRLTEVQPLYSLQEFEYFLQTPGPWLAGFDLPFSLPRALIEHYQWPAHWPDFIDWYGQQHRADLRLAFKAFCDARPVGQKFVYRQTDRPAGSSPAMRWTNPPVAWMLHAGAPRLKAAGLCLPGLALGIDQPLQRRIALEAYPGFTARQVTRASYKSDTPSKQTEARRLARKSILAALIAGQAGLRPRLELTESWRRKLMSDGSGDLIDAAICALQAAHASLLPNYGFPETMDPLEGWIASVPKP